MSSDQDDFPDPNQWLEPQKPQPQPQPQQPSSPPPQQRQPQDEPKPQQQQNRSDQRRQDEQQQQEEEEEATISSGKEEKEKEETGESGQAREEQTAQNQAVIEEYNREKGKKKKKGGWFGGGGQKKDKGKEKKKGASGIPEIKEEFEGPLQVPIIGRPIPKNIAVLERYPLNPPFAYAVIAEDEAQKTRLYLIDELELNEDEKKLYSNIIKTLQMELKVPRTDVDPKEYFAQQAQVITEKYHMKMGKSPQISWAKILYYAERDMVGFGPIDPLMRDTAIEDISVDGTNKPVFVYHRRYEDLQTNLYFDIDENLDNLIVRLVHMSGKHVSTAFPIVDATLPGRHRLAATFRREVSPQGSTLTIRKFREDPITVIDLINFGVLDYTMAAYAWLLMEYRATAIVVGATAAGKTTFMNALLSMIRSSAKVVTIEEVQEVNFYHPNWAPLVSRPTYGVSDEAIGEVSLFDLVRAAMRMRPDVLVVGEVRGSEAYALFQAISTGHGGLCLPSDEPVLALVDGSVRYLHMKELVERVQNGHGVSVVSFDPQTRYVGYFPVTGSIAKSGTQNFIQITLKHGKMVRVHEDHPLIILRDGKLVTISSNSAKPGDLVPVPSKIPLVESQKVLDVLDLLKTDKDIFNMLYVREANMEIVPSTNGRITQQVLWEMKTVREEDRNHSSQEVSVQYFDAATIGPSGNHTISYGRNERNSIPGIIPLSYDFGYILGWVIANGSINEGRRVVIYPGNSVDDSKKISDVLSRIGIKYSKLRIKIQDIEQICIAIDSKIFAHVLKALGIGMSCYTKRIPDIAFNAPREFREGLIAGYWRANGHMRRCRRNSFTSTTTESIELARSLHLLLKTLGVDSAVSYKKPRKQRNNHYDEKSPLYGVQILSPTGKIRLRTHFPSMANVGPETISRDTPSLLFEPIVSVKKITLDSNLYDIEVKGTGNFLHGAAAFTHNCTLHAEDVTSAIQRLTSKPMDVAPSYISFLDLVFSVRRVAIPNPGGGPPKLARRVISVDEVIEFNKYLQVFRWDASTDKYQTPGLEQSAKLRKLARDQGKTVSDVMQEMNDRMQVLQWMKVKNMRNYIEIAGIFSQYHQDKESIMRRARADFQYAPASSPFTS
jgi:type IV secretory pathway ATPase VirB11/archaellum biosynthesis ATPase/intein/homing endonuclease